MLPRALFAFILTYHVVELEAAGEDAALAADAAAAKRRQ
jgi:hypothetical protein